MKRRDFLKTLSLGIISAGFAPDVLAGAIKNSDPASPDDYIKDYLIKMRDFDRPHKGDIYLNSKEHQLLKLSTKRLKRIQKLVGHGNFQLLSFDKMLKIGRSYSSVGLFNKSEQNLLEKLFYTEASIYGFFGKKPLVNLTASISNKDVVKVPGTGNYLYKGQPFNTYKKIKKQVGNKAILTSGVRSVSKQFMLFMNKLCKSKGNLSLASRSLAPPGYSYHGIGDFDVGRVGFGVANFTERFMTTDVFSRLEELGYLKLRYPKDNLLGVRFEPWHIKLA
ncbi:Peptidase M15 [Candidatus Magnetomoraceae bacterium gMMP-1]